MTARESSDRQVTLDVNILGRDYKIACKESERAELMQAVTFLDRRMRDIRDQGKVSGPDRIAVMAALNIAHDLLREKARHARGGAGRDNTAHDDMAAAPGAAEPAIDGASARRRIRDMGTAIDSLLASQEKLF
jgi:cell division protein ZapA